jgi:hypothetical protein
MELNMKNVENYFNKAVFHPTSVTRYYMPWMSDFLIGGLDEMDKLLALMK